jgi:hypothetical protein
MQQTGFFWHVHHDVLMEWCYGYDERKAYNLEHKPAEEQELRLRLFKPVQDVEALTPADKAYEEAEIQAGKVYGETIATADKAYEEAKAQAQKAYEEAEIQAGKVYEEAIAPAQNTHQKAIAQADKAYLEAEAKAWSAYLEAILSVHARECPNCPWNGESIFNE